MKNEKYGMKFQCLNCGNEWEEEIEKGHKINTQWNGTFELENFASAYVRKIMCSKCGCDRDVIKKLN